MILGLFYKGDNFVVGQKVENKDTKEISTITRIWFDAQKDEYRLDTDKGETGPGYVNSLNQDLEIASVV